MKAAVAALADAGVPVAIHAITDGRDVAPECAEGFLTDSAGQPARKARASPRSLGRYWAMDRDNRWDRVERAWRAITLAEGEKVANPVQAMAQAYARGETDEFVAPSVVGDYAAHARATGCSA